MPYFDFSLPMSSRILILGATGRLGYAAAESFRDAGWSVVSQVRPGAAKLALPRTRVVEVDPLDHAAVSEVAHGADVVLHALNPAYQLWRTQALPFAYSAIAAAERAGATLIVSRQSLQLRLPGAAGDRRSHADASDVAQGADSDRHRGPPAGGRRGARAARCTTVAPEIFSAAATAPGSIW